MKIAIIGGGFFGCNIAAELAKNQHILSIDIYETRNKLMSLASSNNQHRFHTGFHYPRSPETIKQIRETSKSFLENFSDCLFEIKNNYYFVSKEGKITFEDYKKYFLDSSKTIQDLEYFKDFLYIEKISGGLISDEKGINLQKLKNKILNNISSKKINILLNNSWKINYLQKKYDFIINCSYYNPNLTTDKIKVKYEICELLLINNPFSMSDYSLTIMDGPFSSLYATENKDIYTLSNVEKTPFYKTDNLNELLSFYNNLKKYNFDNIDKEIILKTKEYFKLNDLQITGRYITPKVKLLNDVNDLRKTEIIFEKKMITVLQGKISTIQYVSNMVCEYIEKNLC